MKRGLRVRIEGLEQHLIPGRMRPIEFIQRVVDGTITDQELSLWQPEIKMILEGAALANADD